MIVGGQFQWLNSAEYFFPLTADDMIRGTVFCDFGTVEREVALHGEQFRVAPGFGFRINVPALGPAPLAFDFAFPVAMADDRPQADVQLLLRRLAIAISREQTCSGAVPEDCQAQHGPSLVPAARWLPNRLLRVISVYAKMPRSVAARRHAKKAIRIAAGAGVVHGGVVVAPCVVLAGRFGSPKQQVGRGCGRSSRASTQRQQQRCYQPNALNQCRSHYIVDRR